jgi:hypothetical protein
VWGERCKRERHTRFENVLRLPTNMISPSTKYAYNVWRDVRIRYLFEVSESVN